VALGPCLCSKPFLHILIPFTNISFHHAIYLFYFIVYLFIIFLYISTQTFKKEKQVEEEEEEEEEESFISESFRKEQSIQPTVRYIHIALFICHTSYFSAPVNGNDCTFLTPICLFSS
jgi:Ca2+/Na+ antiporter